MKNYDSYLFFCVLRYKVFYAIDKKKAVKEQQDRADKDIIVEKLMNKMGVFFLNMVLHIFSRFDTRIFIPKRIFPYIFHLKFKFVIVRDFVNNQMSTTQHEKKYFSVEEEIELGIKNVLEMFKI